MAPTCGEHSRLAQAKKCCFSAKAMAEGYQPQTPVKGAQGAILSADVVELHDSANEAFKLGDYSKATHFYTMAIDVLAKGMPRDANGVAKDADLLSLNKRSEGRLAKLLANRSFTHLKQGDTDAAVEDAGTATRADPAFEKGHLRLLAALEAAGAPPRQLLEACEHAVEACIESEALVTRKWQLKKAVAAEAEAAKKADRDACEEDASASGPCIEVTRRLADDPQDSRRPLAAADLGRSYAVGAHSLPKDLEKAEHYLRIAAEAGMDVAAWRDLGLLLLEKGRPTEAAEELSKAAKAGDEEAAAVMKHLAGEAEAKQAEALAKLEELAAAGDERAQAMLAEFRGGSI
eukprot:TRINITY_DN12551_c0_g1_i1.p1 TRINITY_DN12551_c0_g1~~TRINITY_DN12551_c0_g1_i1.p1  ORF type:complete len:347 (-),score=117.11 TRINITY_DN12551_c0_g1_i1:181-1221(-)